MKKEWSETVVSYISLAICVRPGFGAHIHNNRPYHGFVFNDGKSVKDYIFSDGRVMKTEGGDLFYLPKGSSYRVKVINEGSCYAINFDADIKDEPFALKPGKADSLYRSFKCAADEWRGGESSRYAAAARAIYDAIHAILTRREQSYTPNGIQAQIEPAIKLMREQLTDPELSVERMALVSGISEVYLRRIFLSRFGIPPKEYIIRARMEYARGLLELGELNVSRIAELSGYSEPCHFSREFKRRFGISPSEYYKTKRQ